MKAPVQVILLRALAFLACAFLLTTALYGPSNPFTPEAALPPALPPGSNGSAMPDNGTAPGAEGWRQLLGLLPEHTAEKLLEAWAFGQSHQMGIVLLGLLTCLLAMLLAGRIRCAWGHGTGGQDLSTALLCGGGAENPCWCTALGCIHHAARRDRTASDLPTVSWALLLHFCPSRSCLSQGMMTTALWAVGFR